MSEEQEVSKGLTFVVEQSFQVLECFYVEPEKRDVVKAQRYSESLTVLGSVLVLLVSLSQVAQLHSHPFGPETHERQAAGNGRTC